jgi:hypothetical protein
MAYQPEDFVGAYTMQQGSLLSLPDGRIQPEGVRQFIKAGNTVYVGTGPATALHRTETGDVVGVVVMDGEVQKFPASGSTECHFDAVNRYFRGKDGELVLQISLYWDEPAKFKTTYGVLTYGDPENVGVWGATDQGGL